MTFFGWLFNAQIRVYWLISLLLIGSVFVYGWFIAEPAEPLCYGKCENPSHLFGLKFMPPCEPFGVDSTCGADTLLIIPLLVIWLVGVITERQGESR